MKRPNDKTIAANNSVITNSSALSPTKSFFFEIENKAMFSESNNNFSIESLFSEIENNSVSAVNEKAIDESAKPGQIFSPLEKDPLFKGNNTARNNKLRGKYVIHTMNTLAELLGEERKSNNEKIIIIRWVLTPEGELLLAKEGAPTSTIPAHFAMTGLSHDSAVCKASGNAGFDKEGNLVFLSHKSGDFQPSWDSLQFGLFAFLACGAKFLDKITLQKNITTDLTLSLESLKKELDTRFTPEQKEQCKNLNENVSKKSHVYPISMRQAVTDDTFFANRLNISGKIFNEKSVTKPSIKFELK